MTQFEQDEQRLKQQRSTLSTNEYQRRRDGLVQRWNGAVQTERDAYSNLTPRPLYSSFLMSQQLISSVHHLFLYLCTFALFLQPLPPPIDQLTRLTGVDKTYNMGQRVHFERSLSDGWPLYYAFRINHSDQRVNRRYLINIASIYSRRLDRGGDGNFHPCTMPVLELPSWSTLAGTVTSRNAGLVIVHFTSGFKFPAYTLVQNVSMLSPQY